MITLGEVSYYIRSLITLRLPCCKKPESHGKALGEETPCRERERGQGVLRQQSCKWWSHFGSGSSHHYSSWCHWIRNEPSSSALPNFLNQKIMSKIKLLLFSATKFRSSLLPSNREPSKLRSSYWDHRNFEVGKAYVYKSEFNLKTVFVHDTFTSQSVC